MTTVAGTVALSPSVSLFTLYPARMRFLPSSVSLFSMRQLAIVFSCVGGRFPSESLLELSTIPLATINTTRCQFSRYLVRDNLVAGKASEIRR